MAFMNKFTKFFTRNEPYVGLTEERKKGQNEIPDYGTANESGESSSFVEEKGDGQDTYTIQQALDKMGFGVFQFKLSLLTGLAWAADSMEMMILSILSPALHCAWGISSWKQAFITMTVFGGQFISSSFWGWLCDNHGRRTPPCVAFFRRMTRHHLDTSHLSSPDHVVIANGKEFWQSFCPMCAIRMGVRHSPEESYMRWLKRSDVRYLSLIMSTVVTFFYGVLSAFSPTFYWLLLLRGLVGIGIGGCTQAITFYSEFLPTTTRARGIVIVEMFWTAGSCFQVVLALLIMPTLGWRHLLIYSAVPLLVFTLFCVFLSESPHFDLTQGRADLATKTLEKIAKTNKKSLPKGRLHLEVDTDTIERGRIIDLFTPEWRRTTVLLWVIWFVLGFNYYGVVLLTTSLFEYGNSCYGYTGVDKDMVCLAGCKNLNTEDYIDILWTSVAEFPGNIFAALLVDCIGRTRSISALLSLFAVVVFCINFCTTRLILTILLILSRALISGTFQTIVIYTPEVYTTNIRAIGVGAVTSVSRLGAILSPVAAQVIVKASPHVAISFYGVMAIVGLVAGLLLPYETKGKPMKDVGEPGTSDERTTHKHQ